MTDNPYLRAIEIIKERGWHQGELVGPNGEVCIAGSVRAAFGTLTEAFGPPLVSAMKTVAPMPTGLEDVGPSPWNDDPSRTIEDVYLALKYAAADWDAEHDAGAASA